MEILDSALGNMRLVMNAKKYYEDFHNETNNVQAFEDFIDIRINTGTIPKADLEKVVKRHSQIEID